MAYEEKYRQQEAPNNIIMESRRKLSVSGVENVDSFDETSIILYTSEGMLVIRGDGLHIEKLSLDGGELGVTGFVDSLAYEDDGGNRGSFWSRLFK